MPFIPLPLIIMAGGKSSRMGSDKALLPFSTFPTLTEYQLQRFKPFESIHVSAKNSAKFHFDASFIEDIRSIVNTPRWLRCYLFWSIFKFRCVC